MFEMNYPSVNYREPWLDMPAEPKAEVCCVCGGEHYEGDHYYVDGKNYHVCPDCDRDFHFKMLPFFVKDIVANRITTEEEAFAYMDNEMERSEWNGYSEGRF